MNVNLKLVIHHGSSVICHQLLTNDKERTQESGARSQNDKCATGEAARSWGFPP